VILNGCPRSGIDKQHSCWASGVVMECNLDGTFDRCTFHIDSAVLWHNTSNLQSLHRRDVPTVEFCKRLNTNCKRLLDVYMNMAANTKIVPIGDWGHLLTLTLTSDDLESHVVVDVSSTLTNTTIWFAAALCLSVDVRTYRWKDVRTNVWTDGYFYWDYEVISQEMT